jgi:glycosyltransferase involved in cell wall biosynthesis
MYCVDDLTLILFSRDHLPFVDQCLESIYQEFGSSLKVLNVDVGSIDGTEKRIVQRAKELGISLSQELRPRDTKTLTVLKSLEDSINSQFVVLLSSDDLFTSGYGRALLLALDDLEGDAVLNFSLIETNSLLEPVRLHAPRWTNSVEKNKRMLSIMNPGTAAGSVIPFKKLKTLEVWKSVPPILIEDYWLWWTLIEYVPFINVLNASAIYRKHGNNISGAKRNREYAYSLGFAAGLPRSMNNSGFNRRLSLFLLPRWGRHLATSTWKDFLRGFLDSSKKKGTK